MYGLSEFIFLNDEIMRNRYVNINFMFTILVRDSCFLNLIVFCMCIVLTFYKMTEKIIS